MAMLLASVVTALIMPSFAQTQPPDSDILSRDSTKKYNAVQESWNDFKGKYNYHPDDAAEEKKRSDIFTANIDTVNDVNSQNLDYSLDVNQFAHLSPEEFQSQYLGYRKPDKLWGDTPSLGVHSYSGKPLADSVDWVQKKAVTGIKHQGKCGSCWAFSTTGALEGARAIATGELISLSEQQFLDCDVKSGDLACKGGRLSSAFQFAKDHAICTERSYPYVHINGTCKASACSVGIPKGGILGARYVAQGDLQGLMEAVMQQPVSVTIASSSIRFQLYSKGIWSHSCGLLPDHGVLAVGYGSENGKAYWKLKNSWGPFWGELGYFRIARGTGGKIGHCWILDDPTYPVVTNEPSPPSPPGPGPVAFKGEPIRYSQNKDKCIDLVDGNLTNGNKLQIWDCNGSPSQNWYFESGLEGGSLKSGLDNSKCVDFGDVQEGTEIRIWDCQANKRQDMMQFRIHTLFGTKCLGYQYQQSMDFLHHQPLRCMSLPNGDVTNGNIVTASGCGSQIFSSMMPDGSKWACPSSSLQQSGTQGTVVV